jgi:hypothetical protein
LHRSIAEATYVKIAELEGPGFIVAGHVETPGLREATLRVTRSFDNPI